VRNINNINSVILGTGAYLPDFVLDNAMFDQIIDTNDEWIVSRTGIKERRLEQEKYNYEMLGEACKRALENSGLSPGKIDMIIVSTVTPDYAFPATACFVQNYINAHNAASFDVSAACAGFVFALDAADAYIKSGKAKNILVASGDVLNRTVDYSDRSNCILFGDGAGAVVVSAKTPAASRHPLSKGGFGEKTGILSTYINCECDGQKLFSVYEKLYEPHEIFDKNTKQFKSNAEKIQNSYIHMNGREVYQFVVKVLPESLQEVCSRANITISDLDYIVVHQANKRILDYVIEKYNLDPDKVPMTIDKYGNTSSSSIPILLNELNTTGKLKKDNLIAVVGFGSGLTYGAAVIRWGR